MVTNSSRANQSSDNGNEFSRLLDRAHAGDNEAWDELYHRYRKDILAVIRANLKQPLRRLLDSTDLAQFVWESVFIQIQKGEHFESPAQLKMFVEGIAHNVTRNGYRFHVTTQQRSLSRDQSLKSGQYADKHPNPAAQAETADELEHVLSSLSERDRAILLALRDGDCLDEAAATFGCSVKTIRPLLEQCRCPSGGGADTPAA